MVRCRGCGAELSLSFLDLGFSPVANNLISAENVNSTESYFPLHAMTCSKCALVQLPEVASRESLFPSDYVYFSSYSSSWLEHSRAYVSKIVEMLKLNNDDLVVEVASNDGYLLQYFVELGIQVLGIEPSGGVAEVAKGKGIPTLIDFFGANIATELSKIRKPRLMIGNNVLAHVPDIHDFIEGFSKLIADDGLITFEFPHLVNLINNNEFDTIYHEHYSYLSITALMPIVEKYGLKFVDIEKLSTHGGSIRVYLVKEQSSWKINDSVKFTLMEESTHDPRSKIIRESVQARAFQVKEDLVNELIKCKRSGIRVAAYGAAAKGNTLLNYAEIGSDLIEYVVDLNPHKQGKFLPGSRIPVVGIEELKSNTPEVILVLPWNLAKEIKEQLSLHMSQRVKLLRAVPSLEYF
jgi:SAM-dependent methyltransferase